MPWRRAPSCANAPTCAYRLIIPDSHGLRNQNFSIFHQFLFLLPLAIISVCIASLPSPAGKDPAGIQLLLQRFWITGRIQGSLHAGGILCQGIHRDLADMIPGPCRRIGTDLGIRAKGAFGKFCRPGALCKKMQPALRAGIRHEGGAVLCPFFLASGQFRAPVLPQGIVRRSACCADGLPPVPCQGRGRDGERPFTLPCQQVSEEEAP